MTTKVTKTPVLDATSPDSGVGDGEMLGEIELKKRALEEELEKIEGEVQTLRQVLKNKVERATEIRNTLVDMGYGERSVAELMWMKGGAIGESIGGGIDTFKKSAPVLKAGEVMNDISTAAAPFVTMFYGQLGQLKALPAPDGWKEQTGSTMEKATDVYRNTVEKTSSLFSKVKENAAVNTITERLGGVYTAARSKLPGAGGGDLEDAFKEGEKAVGEQPQAQGLGEQPQDLGAQQQPPVQQQQQQQLA